MKKLPHCSIGALLSKSRKHLDAFNYGTGTLISHDLVLTSAHNLYNYSTGEVYKEIKFYPGQDGDLKDPCEIEDVFIPGKYILKPSVEHDYALLKLKDKVRLEEFMHLNEDIEELSKDPRLSIFGYPTKDNYKPTNQELTKLKAYQFGSTNKGRVEQVNEDQSELVHRISTWKGHSGSAVILADQLRIAAIHKAGKVNANIATLVT